MVPYMHKIIVVTCEEDLQLQRLMEQRHLSERESKLMIGAQEICWDIFTAHFVSSYKRDK